MAKIPRRKVPALVGRKEAARLLGMRPENMPRLASVPEPLQERGIEGFEVSTGPLWPRAEIEDLAADRLKKKARAAAKAKRELERSAR